MKKIKALLVIITLLSSMFAVQPAFAATSDLRDWTGACLTVSDYPYCRGPVVYIENRSFESGNLNGWEVTGDAFTVTSDTNWGWGGDFKQKGTYHIWGAKNGDDKTGTLESSTFRAYNGKTVDFLIGGGNDWDNLYVALIDASTGEVLFKATGSETGEQSEQYHRVVWTINAPTGYKDVYFKVVDTKTTGWGHINVDDFHSNYDTIVSDYYTNIANHDFESGNLAGWVVESGTAFSAPQYRGYWMTNGDVTSDTNWGWGGPFNHNGTYHLWGYKEGGDADTGVLKSLTYTLGGRGQVDFLIGGGNDIDNLYVALVRASDGRELMKATGKGTEQYSRITWDASSALGEKVYIKVVDNSTGDFGHLNIDDVNMQVVPQYLFNHSFENIISIPWGLRGWTVVSGNAFSTNDVVNDSTWWGGSFNRDGSYHLYSFKDGGDGQVGVLKSENFVLSNNGVIDFLVSGGNDINNLYVALVRASDGAELFQATGENSETYRRVTWNALQYVGTEMYIKLVDNATGDWGHINLDDVNMEIQSGTHTSDKQAPTAPANLVVTNRTSSEVTLSWTGSTDNTEVYSYLISTNYSTTSTKNGTDTTFTVPAPPIGSVYTYTVKAEDHAGNVSAASNSVTVDNR